MARHAGRSVNRLFVLIGVLSASAAVSTAAVVQTFLAALNSTIPPSQASNFGSHRILSPMVPPIFFAYLSLLTAFLVADLIVVQRLRSKQMAVAIRDKL